MSSFHKNPNLWRQLRFYGDTFSFDTAMANGKFRDETKLYNFHYKSKLESVEFRETSPKLNSRGTLRASVPPNEELRDLRFHTIGVAVGTETTMKNASTR